MKPLSRRDLLKLSAAGAASASVFRSASAARTKTTGEESEIGIYLNLDPQDVDGTFRQIRRLGFSKCELYTDDYSMNLVEPLNTAIDKHDVEVLAMFTLGPGPSTWDFYEGQENIGLVSKQHRGARITALKQLSNLAAACNVPMVETHAGYISENPNDPNYVETVNALKEIVGYCHEKGQTFLYHAGQESPTTLRRVVNDVGFDNQGVGFDTANLIMYDRGHPVHAVDVYGDLIKLVNAKDGLYPTGTRELGKEVQVGQGEVNFPLLMKKLKASGYSGEVIIEREATSGLQWEKDVLQSKAYLAELI